ncbi:L,D-transpeptidase [Tropicibacter naphthalenivorans]|uniref:Putative L,D-transpeptidase YkuD n=1 Tax=Tropicibacter naphthalenivorans TaxID=441103 RepID=A0A0P1G0S6_9RHOB|nr:L,D-transpeptidase [Tropicibacter naphthalenivorans]CUH75360.1 Putative L,D-transpeptidase YkuD [Tropicibacter naphthalenivorans]SMC44900.1 L,D-transpeptidase catalytic domain [Tropicibacter naphthalenivorans]
MNRILTRALGVAMLCLLPMASVAAPLVAKVDISAQTMTVIYNGKVAYSWPVSTARSGKYTPRGTWTAKWLSKNHRSSLYNNAPMPYSIFFNGNYAIHGTNQISRLGRPASAGCVRLHPEHAAVLFKLTQSVGKQNMKVVIQN